MDCLGLTPDATMAAFVNGRGPLLLEGGEVETILYTRWNRQWHRFPPGLLRKGENRIRLVMPPYHAALEHLAPVEARALPFRYGSVRMVELVLFRP